MRQWRTGSQLFIEVAATTTRRALARRRRDIAIGAKSERTCPHDAPRTHLVDAHSGALSHPGPAPLAMSGMVPRLEAPEAARTEPPNPPWAQLPEVGKLRFRPGHAPYPPGK